MARLSTSELELRRQQIEYRLAATAGQWSFGRGLGTHDVIGERNDLLKEKEAIERELLRRAGKPGSDKRQIHTSESNRFA